MQRILLIGGIGCGAVVLLALALFVGVVIGSSGSDSPDSVLEEQESGNGGEPQEPQEKPQREPIELSGTGPQASEPIELRAGLVRFDMTHEGESNFAVELLNEAGDSDLVVSEIGPFDGSQAIQVPEDGSYVVNVVYADGPWTVTVR